MYKKHKYPTQKYTFKHTKKTETYTFSESNTMSKKVINNHSIFYPWTHRHCTKKTFIYNHKQTDNQTFLLNTHTLRYVDIHTHFYTDTQATKHTEINRKTKNQTRKHYVFALKNSINFKNTIKTT